MATYTIVRENWLTRKIDSSAALTATVITLALVLGALIYWGDVWRAEQWMAASREQVFGAHQWWRAWTTLLVHADPRHLLSNSLLFFILGVFIYGYFGFLIFPVLAFFVGGITNLIVLWRMPPAAELIGVSGVVFWMGSFWLTLYFIIDRRKSLVQRALRASGVGLVLFFPAEAFDPSISYECHLIGFFLGIPCALIFYWLNRQSIRAAEIHETIVDDESIPDDLGT
jgi:rhomboid protease GluP